MLRVASKLRTALSCVFSARPRTDLILYPARLVVVFIDWREFGRAWVGCFDLS